MHFIVPFYGSNKRWRRFSNKGKTCYCSAKSSAEKKTNKCGGELWPRKKNTWHLAMTRSITHGDDQSQFHLRKTTTGKFGERRITLPSWQKYFPVHHNYSSCPPIRTTFQWVNSVISLTRETHPIMTIISQHLPNQGILLDTPNKKIDRWLWRISRFPIHPAIRWRFWCSQRPLDLDLSLKIVITNSSCIQLP